MRFTYVVVILLIALGVNPGLEAEEANLGEAHDIAARYLEYLTARFESWGEGVTPVVGAVEELERNGRSLGWVFHVEPEGFLIVSRHKELGAVKAWSAHGHFDAMAQQGIPSLVGDLMRRNIADAEQLAGRPIEGINREQWSSIAEINYRDSWTHGPTAVAKSDTKSSGSAGMDYEEGEVLLSTNWHQDDPFNRSFPPVFDQSVQCRDHALVGCVATAGAQLMRYWAWPPAAADGTYVDRYWWTHMPDAVTASSPQEQIDAVGGISYNLAIAVNMQFSCDESGAYTVDMHDVYENRRYHSDLRAMPRFTPLFSYTPEEWFEFLKAQYNQNRPVHYKVDRHSIVGDGWYEVEVGETTERWYHFNYGWLSSTWDTWYLLDGIPLGDPEIEYFLTEIHPDISEGPTLVGFYPTQWLSANHFDRPSRYFDRDVTATNAEFEAGQGLQYVRPGFWIRNAGTSAEDEIVFHGEPEAATEFYHEAPFGDVKIRISDGAVVIRGGGEMALY